MPYYHGSSQHLPEGTILEAQPGYKHRWGEMLSYIVLEKYRPKGFLPHSKAVFMVGGDFEWGQTEDDLEAAGASLDYIYEVEPSMPITQHDVNIHSMIEAAFSDHIFRDVNPSFLDQTLNPRAEQILKSLARGYWFGEENAWGEEPIWEYLADKARILRLVGGVAEELHRLQRLSGINDHV